jgi:RNA polymerase sigma-70 factor (ECF subfamily)
VQETLISVIQKMPGYKYDPALGSFKGWLRQVTGRRIVDQWRKRLPEDRPGQGGDAGSALENLPDATASAFESLWEEEWQKHMLQAALRRVRRKVHPKQFQMYDLYVTAVSHEVGNRHPGSHGRPGLHGLDARLRNRQTGPR